MESENETEWFELVPIAPAKMLTNIHSYSEYQDFVWEGNLRRKWRTLEENPAVWENPICTIQPEDELEDVENVTRNTPSLKAVKVCRMDNYSKMRQIVGILVRNCREVHYLDFTDNLIAHEELGNILSQLPEIEYLAIRPFSSIASGCVQLIFNNCSSLRHLVLSSSLYEESSRVDIKPLGDGCPKLERIDFSKLKHSAEDLVYIMRRKSVTLKSIRINSLCLSDVLIPFYRCLYLEEIYCFFRENDADLLINVLQGIRSTPKLKCLQFVNLCSAQPDTITHFFSVKFFPRLIKVNLNRFLNVRKELRLEIRGRLPYLRSLCLNGCDYIPSHQMECFELFELENLEHLELRRRRIFSARCFRQLLNCQNLLHLDIAGSTINDTQASVLLKKLQLRYLNVAECQSLTDSFLKCVPSCQTLLILILDGCKFSKKTLNMVASKMPSTTISTTDIRFRKKTNVIHTIGKYVNLCLRIYALVLANNEFAREYLWR